MKTAVYGLTLVLLVAIAVGVGWVAKRRTATPVSTGALGQTQNHANAITVVASQLYEPKNLEFSTYFGGSDSETTRGMFVDARGNVYLAGGTSSPDVPTTPEAYQRTYAGGTQDGLITKWDPAGKLIWATLLGGPGHDRFYTVKVDSAGYVYVSGRGGPGLPTTAGVFQPNFGGSPDGIYGPENGYVAKLSPDGSRVIWASYVGSGWEVRDMELDDEGNIYMTLPYTAKSTFVMPPTWFAKAFSKTPHGSEDCGVIKISNDGTHVIWATFIGGSSGNSQDNSLAVGPDHEPVLFMGLHSADANTTSTDLPTTPWAFSQTPNSAWLGKMSADGSSLVFGTYIGDGTANAAPRTHDVAIDQRGNIFVAVTPRGHWPVTFGALQTAYGGGGGDFGIAKFSGTGALLAATYVGGSGDECNGPDTLSIDEHGNVVITGGTGSFCDSNPSANYPITTGAFQSKLAGRQDGVVSVLSNDLSRLLYSTYMGGSGADMLRANWLTADGALYVAGQTTSRDWPTKNAYQNTFKGNVRTGIGNIVLAKIRVQIPDRTGAPSSSTTRY